MKYLQKGSPPDEYTQWCASGNEDWQPAYGDLRGPLKDTVKTALMREQGGICCYCEQTLAMDDSHVEHVRPQHLAEVDPLDFTNMACSCQDQVEKGKPRHCGNAKLGWYDSDLFISPFEIRCERAFAYTGDGRIKPACEEDQAARTTIENLRLGIKKLNDSRADALEPFLDSELSSDEFQTFVEGYLRPNPDEIFKPFWTTIAYLFSHHHLATP